MSDGDVTLARLADQQGAILASLAALREAIDRLSHSSPRPARRALSAADVALLGALLPVIATAFPGEVFKVREVLAHPATELQAAAEGLTAARLGTLLSYAADGGPLGGFLVERVIREGGVQVWAVSRKGGQGAHLPTGRPGIR